VRERLGLLGGVLPGRLDTLPIEPKRLKTTRRRELRQAADFNPDAAAQSLEMLQVIEEILANPLASPQLRGAAYEVPPISRACRPGSI
jgi:hypothetical protein